MGIAVYNKEPLVLINAMESYFKSTPPDCSLFSDDNYGILIHKELMYQTKVVYMSFSFLQLAVESRDLSQAEKYVTVVKPEQIHKMTIIFTQTDNFCYFVNLLSF